MSNHTTNKMSTRRSQRHSRRHEDGNHHLTAAVIALTAIFLALGIYTFVYRNRPRPVTNTALPTTTTTQTNNPTVSTPTGRTSFVGVIREINDDRMTIRTSTDRDGVTTEFFVVVTVPPNTDIGLLGLIELSLNPDPSASRPRTPASMADLKVGTGLEVFSNSVIDNQTMVTAARIDILTQPT